MAASRSIDGPSWKKTILEHHGKFVINFGLASGKIVIKLGLALMEIVNKLGLALREIGIKIGLSTNENFEVIGLKQRRVVMEAGAVIGLMVQG